MPFTKHKTDRRAHSRYPVEMNAYFEPSAHVTSQKKQIGSKVIQNLGQIQNISEGGLCTITATPLDPSQIVTVHLPILKRPAITTRTLAQVIWIKPTLRSQRKKVGLRFIL